MRYFRKGGFTLIEMSFVVAIIGMMLMAFAPMLKEQAQKNQGSRIGDEAATLLGAVNTYGAQYFEELMNNTPIAGVANPLAPTIAELKNVGGLPASFQTANSMGSGWIIQIDNRVPDACTPPACDISWLVTTDAGLLQDDGSGEPNTRILTSAMDRLGGNGGFSTTDAPGTVSGVNGSWTQPNPAGAVKGVLAARGGFGASGYSQFVRMGDSRNVTLTGDLTVNGANGVTATGVTSNGNLQVAGTTTLTGAASLSNNLTVNGTTSLKGTSATTLNTTGAITTASLTATGKVTGQYLVASTSVTAGAACGAGVADGTIAKAADGSIYSCRSGIWTASSMKSCVHGSYVGTTPGSAAVTIPVECKTFTVVHAIGGGGAGASGGNPGLDVNGDCHRASGGGGASGAYQSNVVINNTAGPTYNVTVGDGGTIAKSGAVARAWCAWTIGSSGSATTITSSGVTIFSVAGGDRAGGHSAWDRNPPDNGWNGAPPGFASYTGVGANNGTWGIVNDSYWLWTNQTLVGGKGADSPFGAGGAGGTKNINAKSPAATAYGAGGGGGAHWYTTTTDRFGDVTYNYVSNDGADGAQGYIEITW